MQVRCGVFRVRQRQWQRSLRREELFSAHGQSRGDGHMIFVERGGGNEVALNAQVISLLKRRFRNRKSTIAIHICRLVFRGGLLVRAWSEMELQFRAPKSSAALCDISAQFLRCFVEFN